MKIDILCISRIKKGHFKDLIDEFSKRIQWQLTIKEYESKIPLPQKKQLDEMEKISSFIVPDAVIIAMDERGKSYKSMEFAHTIKSFQDHGQTHFQFIIGGADGLTDDIRKKSDILLSFGKQTWPHHLARVMLIEQIYRTQQILAGHPYHRE